MDKKILIIEDEQYLIDMYTMKFESEGYQVISASNGQEGLKLAKKEKPDLILLDLIMPKMDGFQVLKEMRQDEATKNSIIYIFSNLGQGAEVEQGMENGANGYFVKSNLTPTQLLKKVKMILAGQDVVDDSKSADRLVAPKKYAKQKIKGSAKKDDSALSVLLIEDEAPILKMYQEKLENDGIAVEPSLNGAWGLNMATKRKFDVIIMDMNMPAMNGFKAIEEIRKSSENKETPIMVLSNSAQDAEITRAKKLGADHFFLKARITPSRLVKEINKRYAK